MPTDLTELLASERSNFDATSKYIGHALGLVNDLEKVYELGVSNMTNFPLGRTSDSELSAHAVLTQFMMCRMLVTQGTLSVLKLYQGDAMMHLRKSIEMCAFAVRISKHPELGRIWLEAGLDQDSDKARPKYKSYRKEFRTEVTFPEVGTADHDPALTKLKDTWELCSKPVHGGIYGVANFIGNAPKHNGGPSIAFFDLQNDLVQSVFFYVVTTHLIILQLFTSVIEIYMDDSKLWRDELKYVAEKQVRFLTQWQPTILALNAARNSKAKS